MSSFLLTVAARILIPAQLLLSLFFLLRGHNQPGGGFVAGLVACSAVALHLVANGSHAVRRTLRVDPAHLSAAGLGLALAVAALSIPFTGQVLEGLWVGPLSLPLLGDLKLGSVLLFDLGVFMVVVGTVTHMMLLLSEGWR